MPIDKLTGAHNGAEDVMQQALRNSSDLLSRCANEIEVFGGGVACGIVESGADKLSHDQVGLASRGAIAMASGALLGFASHEYPAMIATALFTGGAFALYDYSRTAEATHQIGTLSRACSIAWNTHDRSRLHEASTLVSKGTGHAAFEALFTASASAIGGGIGLATWSRMQPEPCLVNLPPSSNLSFKPESNIFIEKVRRPTAEWLGLRNYSGIQKTKILTSASESCGEFSRGVRRSQITFAELAENGDLPRNGI